MMMFVSEQKEHRKYKMYKPEYRVKKTVKLWLYLRGSPGLGPWTYPIQSISLAMDV